MPIDNVTVIFVLGGPGAGKGTQCARLVDKYGFTHLSAGDLLRAEQDRQGSEYGQLIKDYIKDGKIVPMEVTIALLENAMKDAQKHATGGQEQKDDKKEEEEEEKKAPAGKPGMSTHSRQAPSDRAKSSSAKAPQQSRFLIDGFPRKLDQALKFEDDVCAADFILFYECSEEAMEKRILERGKSSGRADDNIESIRKRFKTFEETSMPVVEYFEHQGRVVRIDASPGPDEVFERTQANIEERLGGKF